MDEEPHGRKRKLPAQDGGEYLKKLGYWLMIMVAFGAGAVFIEIGNSIGIDLGITTLLGWFVLASLIVNEIRSICENFGGSGVTMCRRS